MTQFLRPFRIPARNFARILARIPACALAALLAWALPAEAALVRIDASGGGQQLVYQIGDDRFLGLIGIDARGAQYDARGLSRAELERSIVGSDRIVGYYQGPGLAALTGDAEFDPVSFDIAGPENGKIFGAVWVAWEGGALNLRKWSADGLSPRLSGTLSARVTLEGNPLAPVAPVPLPPALAFSLAALGSLGLFRRRQRRKA